MPGSGVLSSEVLSCKWKHMIAAKELIMQVTGLTKVSLMIMESSLPAGELAEISSGQLMG